MLKSLYIQNYRLFRDLHLPRLGRVNLITGKNNTGKTALLEAIRIWASKGDAYLINHVLFERGSWGVNKKWQEDYASLFYKHDLNKSISINDLSIEFKEDESSDNFDEVYAHLDGRPAKKLNTRSFQEGKTYDKLTHISSWEKQLNFDNVWDRIALTANEQILIKVLKVIDPTIDRVSVINNEVKVRAKENGIEKAFPLKHFGNGINWIAEIGLALTDTKNNILLIDEIDSGFHYSVLEKLWAIIFEYAELLNIQVFATTHSSDCVEAFTEVALQSSTNAEYFRLGKTRNTNQVKVTYYTLEQLETAVLHDIEVR